MKNIGPAGLSVRGYSQRKCNTGNYRHHNRASLRISIPNSLVPENKENNNVGKICLKEITCDRGSATQGLMSKIVSVQFRKIILNGVFVEMVDRLRTTPSLVEVRAIKI